MFAANDIRSSNPSTSSSIPSKYQTFFKSTTEKKGFHQQTPRFEDHLYSVRVTKLPQYVVTADYYYFRMIIQALVVIYMINLHLSKVAHLILNKALVGLPQRYPFLTLAMATMCLLVRLKDFQC